MGALVVYDITNRASFEALDEWIGSLLEKANQDIQVMLVGNKLDMVHSNPNLREVDIEEAQRFAQDNGFMFVETSA